MAVSASGTITLLVLIFIGPFLYLCKYLCNRFFAKKKRADEEPAPQAAAAAAATTDGPGGVEGYRDEGGIETLTPTAAAAAAAKEEYSSTAYLFSLVGYAIGIGNVWRFPYVVANNGGAACVVAYLVCAACAAVPLFLYEMVLGQYTRHSFLETWRSIKPRWLSFGYAQFALLFILQTYYAMVIAYIFPYIVGSCKTPLPWDTNNMTSQTYWSDVVLNTYDDWETKPRGLGPIQWKLAVSLFLFWCITFFSVAFGKQVLANITYVTVIMPVVLMIILVIVTAQLPGALDGIQFYIGKFDASELAKLDVWATALSQILFSLGPGLGTAVTYSSFVKPKEDLYRAGIAVAVSNSAFSLLAGFAVFAMVGHMAYVQDKPVDVVAQASGTGLVFVVIAEAMTLFAAPAVQNVMSVLFFVMLFTLGLDSSYAWTETLVSAIEDFMTIHGYTKPKTWKITLTLSVVVFLLGLIFATRMGNAVLDTFDMFIGVIFLLIVCFVESVIMNVDFGWKRMSYALKSATIGNKSTPEGRNLFPRWLCRVDFHFFVPVATIFLAIYQIIYVARTPYGGYPPSLIALGWTVLAICISIIFLTIWKCDPTSLPPIEDDPKFQCLFTDKDKDGDGTDKNPKSMKNGDEESAASSSDDKTDGMDKGTAQAAAADTKDDKSVPTATIVDSGVHDSTDAGEGEQEVITA